MNGRVASPPVPRWQRNENQKRLRGEEQRTASQRSFRMVLNLLAQEADDEEDLDASNARENTSASPQSRSPSPAAERVLRERSVVGTPPPQPRSPSAGKRQSPATPASPSAPKKRRMTMEDQTRSPRPPDTPPRARDDDGGEGLYGDDDGGLASGAVVYDDDDNEYDGLPAQAEGKENEEEGSKEEERTRSEEEEEEEEDESERESEREEKERREEQERQGEAKKEKRRRHAEEEKAKAKAKKAKEKAKAKEIKKRKKEKEEEMKMKEEEMEEEAEEEEEEAEEVEVEGMREQEVRIRAEKDRAARERERERERLREAKGKDKATRADDADHNVEPTKTKKRRTEPADDTTEAENGHEDGIEWTHWTSLGLEMTAKEPEIITRAILDGIVSFEGEIDEERSQELARFHDAVENALQEIVDATSTYYALKQAESKSRARVLKKRRELLAIQRERAVLGEQIRVLEEQNAKARDETKDVTALDRYLAKLRGLRQSVAKLPPPSQDESSDTVSLGALATGLGVGGTADSLRTVREVNADLEACLKMIDHLAAQQPTTTSSSTSRKKKKKGT